MKITFDINLNSGHLFRFYMYQAYTGMQGIVSVILCILGFIMAGISAKSGHMANTMMYLVFGLVFLLYVPGALYMRSKSNLKKNQVFGNTLHFDISEEGIRVSQNGDSGELMWDQIYKMITVKNLILIYTNRVNAYILPIEQIGRQYSNLRKLAMEQLEKCRVRMREQ